MNLVEQQIVTSLVQFSGTLTQGGVVKWFTPLGQHCTEIVKVSQNFKPIARFKVQSDREFKSL